MNALTRLNPTFQAAAQMRGVPLLEVPISEIELTGLPTRDAVPFVPLKIKRIFSTDTRLPPYLTNREMTMTTVDKFVGLGSQIISAFGKQPTQQFVPKIGVIPNQYYTTQQIAHQAGAQAASHNAAAQIAAANQAALQQAAQSSAGAGNGALESGAEGVVNFVKNNTVVVGAAVIGAFLLFKQPPGRR